MFETLTLSELSREAARMLRRASSTRPAIWLVQEGSAGAVVKDFSTNRCLFRNTAGRFLVWREAKAYRKLRGVTGIPVLYRVMDGMGLAVQHIPGRSLENLEREVRLSEEFFDELQGIVDRCHRRGVAHCDLKRAANTLLGDDGHPYIVDWAASISRTEFRGPLLGLIYRRFLLDDALAVIKLKLRHIPEAVTPEEKARYAYRPGLERVIRKIRDRLRDLLQKFA